MNDPQNPFAPFVPPGEPVEATPAEVVLEQPEASVTPDSNPAPENPLGPTTANRDEARLIVQRSNGSGQREVSPEKLEQLMRDSNDWIVVYTNYVAPHHSDHLF